jgi:hypothetical protein
MTAGSPNLALASLNPTPCTGSDEGLGAVHTDGADYVPGIEAPIGINTDGALCDNAADFVADWIGVQNGSQTSIAQIGIEHDYDSSDNGRFCAFTAYGSGGLTFHDYNCSIINSDFYYFLITPYGGDYDLYDCGTASGSTTLPYGSCVSKNASQALFTNSVGLATTETDVCSNRIMGSTANPVTYGTNTNPIQLQDSDTGAFAPRSMTTQSGGASCSSGYHRQYDSTNHVMTAWDGNNS